MRPYAIILGLSLVIAMFGCAASENNIEFIMKNPETYDGKIISVNGRIVKNKEYFNIFSEDKKECIGLLIGKDQVTKFSALNGKMASLVGILESQGCGHFGVCVEHLCSPVILSDVKLCSDAVCN